MEEILIGNRTWIKLLNPQFTFDQTASYRSDTNSRDITPFKKMKKLSLRTLFCSLLKHVILPFVFKLPLVMSHKSIQWADSIFLEFIL